MRYTPITTLKFMAGLIVSGACMTACASGPETLQDLSPELQELAVVSLSNPDAQVPEGGNFTWLAQSQPLLDDPRVDAVQLNSFLQEIIEETLSDKGFTFRAWGPWELKVGYYVAMEEALDVETINQLYGFNPGWAPEKEEESKYLRGTLILDIKEAATMDTVWCGAFLVKVDFELNEELGRQRLERAVRKMMAGFPSKSP